MECLHPFLRDDCWFPCGRCLPCRIRKKREWVARLSMELTTFKGEALFLTLTYCNDTLRYKNGIPTLDKKDIQKYFKRVRKRLKGRKIKYFACGEYGDRLNALKRNSGWTSPLGRPHYHVIMFGVGVSDIPILKDAWSLDDCADWRWNPVNKSAVGFVERDSMGYVAGYVQKKKDQKKTDSLCSTLDIENPFQLSSQGLGYQYVDEHADKILETCMISDGKHSIGLPQTIKRHLGVDCSGRRLTSSNPVVGAYFDKIAERKEYYKSDAWQETSKRRSEAFKLGVRGQAYVDYMSNTEKATLEIKECYASACAKKGIEVTTDYL